MEKLTNAQSFFVWVAGYDKATAEQCTSSEIRKLTIVGSMILIPAFIAIFSYSYGFYFIFGNHYAAIVGGVAAAIVLFVVDRSITAYGRPGSFSFGMLGRVVLAITIGLLLAEPLIIKVFEDSIQEQQYGELSQAKAITAVKYDEAVVLLNSDLAEDQEKLDHLREGYTKEMDGTGGSGIRNQGPIFQKKYQDYLNYQVLYNAKSSKVDAEIKAVQNDKANALRMVELNNANGLIGRMRALSKLGENEPIVNWTTWLLRVFFTIIELLPLLIKISPTGDRKLYYKLIDMNDAEKEKIFEMSSKERMAVKQQEEKLRLTNAFAELCHKETQVIASNMQKDSIYLMAKAQEMTERKIDFVARALKNIKDETLLSEVLASFEAVHTGFMNVISQLISKSNSNFSTNN